MFRCYSFYEYVFGCVVNIKIVGGGFILLRVELYLIFVVDVYIFGVSFIRSFINYNVFYYYGEKFVFWFVM